MLTLGSYIPKNRIATAVDKARAALGRHGTGGRAFAKSWLAKSGLLELVPQMDAEPTGKPVNAEVNHGRWICNCETCHGAEVVDPADPFFFCLSCLNKDNDHNLRPVMFPAGMQRIEAVLLERKEARQRNWETTDTIEKLVTQNIEHGDRPRPEALAIEV